MFTSRFHSRALPYAPLGTILLVLLGVGASGCDGLGPQRYEEVLVAGHTDRICPGDPSGLCDFSDNFELRVGSAKVSITPTAWETWTDTNDNGEYDSGIDSYLDCGADRLCPEDGGYPGPDAGEANGEFEALWIAGFGNGRPLQDVADDTWARATVIEQGNTTLGLVSIDVVGFFYDEVHSIRAAAQLELGIDHVVVASTHVHEAPDTVGIWGPNLARTGQNADYMAQIHLAIGDALREAQTRAVAASAYAGTYRIGDEAWDGRGINAVNIDKRAPHIVDPSVQTLRFEATGSGETLATWVNFANHPEAAGDRNTSLTSDFAHTLRTTVEEGADQGPAGALAGAGGVATYWQGACGGMMTPLGVEVPDLDGNLYTESSLEKSYAVGRVTGYHALQALDGEQLIPEALLRFRTKELFLPVENATYHLALNLGVLARTGYNYDEDELIGTSNIPQLLTEVSVIELGNFAAITVPGELLPELLLGGYDGAFTGPLQPLVDEGATNPPDLDTAPAGPYLRDLMPGDFQMVLGLANDEIGYIIPDYNYALHPNSPYLSEAEGDHYEETNSVGPQTTSLVVGALTQLLAFEPPEL